MNLNKLHAKSAIWLVITVLDSVGVAYAIQRKDWSRAVIGSLLGMLASSNSAQYFVEAQAEKDPFWKLRGMEFPFGEDEDNEFFAEEDESVAFLNDREIDLNSEVSVTDQIAAAMAIFRNPREPEIDFAPKWGDDPA